MKNFFLLAAGFILTSTFFARVDARDLTYKFGAGFRQAYTNAFLDDTTSQPRAEQQVNGLEMTYGIAKDMQAGLFLGMLRNFDATLVGPKFRYDLHRLFDRDEESWKHINLYVEAAFLAKLGQEIKSGVTLHAPYFGLEIFPMTNVDFAVSVAAGLVVDIVKKNYIGFTNAMFGDVGIKYYF